MCIIIQRREVITVSGPYFVVYTWKSWADSRGGEAIEREEPALERSLLVKALFSAIVVISSSASVPSMKKRNL
jgi:hypothetical protein